MSSYTNEIQILHFSDMHFGKHNIGHSPDPDDAIDGYKDIATLITDDLKKLESEDGNLDSPLIVALSGDFTQIAAHNEFAQAKVFLDKLISSKLLNREVTKEEIFMIPGNHDVVFDKSSENERFQPYCSFYNEFFDGVRPYQLPHKAIGLTQIHIRNQNGNKTLVAEINCCMYVQKDTINQSKGQVSMESIQKLKNDLEGLEKDESLKEYIKIAIIHHHVVLLPSLIEPGRGIDAVQNAQALLELLSKFNFHLILHGHKHYPQIFLYDPLPLWIKNENKIPQLVISGGSCGSRELPQGKGSCNTYSLITIKWHPEACQCRVKILTRGLQRMGDLRELPPYEWKWQTINLSDKILTPYKTTPNSGIAQVKQNVLDDSLRKKEYRKLRCYFPVVEVIPSLIPEQAYEAKFWVVSHYPTEPDKELVEVIWSAGKKFSEITVQKETNETFCSSFHYWGPMLIECNMKYRDGYQAKAYIYARLPKVEA
ncbi:MAG: metallophosphoesterase [Bacteroidetes bacterium]|nr:metallophosphoesterase [Bacteroidota bacterium]